MLYANDFVCFRYLEMYVRYLELYDLLDPVFSVHLVNKVFLI